MQLELLDAYCETCKYFNQVRPEGHNFLRLFDYNNGQAVLCCFDLHKFLINGSVVEFVLPYLLVRYCCLENGSHPGSRKSSMGNFSLLQVCHIITSAWECCRLPL